MQQLYYDRTSSLYLTAEDGSKLTWPQQVTSLIISASANQIIAYTGSSILTTFPLSNTNINYPPFPSEPSNINQQTSINNAANASAITLVPTQFSIAGNFNNNDISGSAFYVYNTTSGSYVVSSSGDWINTQIRLLVGNSHTLTVRKFLGSTTDYTASLYIQELPSSAVTSSYYIFTGSRNSTEITASFTPLLHHNYSINASIFNGEIPINYYFNNDSGDDIEFGIRTSDQELILSGSNSGTIITAPNLNTYVYMEDLSFGPGVFLGSLTVYDNLTRTYITSQSLDSPTYLYQLDGWYPEQGHNYTVSANANIYAP